MPTCTQLLLSSLQKAKKSLKVTKTNSSRLEAAHHWWHRRMLCISWKDMVSNEVRKDVNNQLSAITSSKVGSRGKNAKKTDRQGKHQVRNSNRSEDVNSNTTWNDIIVRDVQRRDISGEDLVDDASRQPTETSGGAGLLCVFRTGQTKV